MASMQRTGASREVDEEEYEDYEEVEIEEEVEGEDYEEAFEEEEEIEQNEEEEEGDEKKVVEFQDYEEAFEEEEEVVEKNMVKVQDDEEYFEEEEEEEDLDEVEKKVVKVQDSEEAFEEEEEVVEKKMVKVQDYEEYFEEEEEEEEEEMEQDEEEEDEDEKKEVKVQDYEEAFEEEEEMEQNKEEEEEDVKKVVKVQKVQEDVEESVQDPVREEDKSANPEQPSESEGNTLPPPTVLPPFLQSVSDLEKLHCALSKFLYQWNSLNRSLDSITAAIDAHALSQHDARSTEQEKDERSGKQEEKDERSEQGKEKDERSWAEILCEEMNGKALLKYLESNFSDYHLLRHEVPEALRRLPNPEKLVFDAIGEFYAHRRTAYNNNTPLVSFRRASVRLLELFVISGRPTGDSSVKREAHLGALLWWKRLANENIETASLVDSLGLILFLASFGIPKDFCSKNLGILLLKSNLKKKIDLFRRSSILVEKIPGVIKDLIRGQMYFEAAELSCYFGLTDTFPPLPLLSSFVAKVIQTGKLDRHKSQSAPRLAKQAATKELNSLRSVVKCMENHNLDIHNLTSVNIHQKISDLERYIDEKDEMKSKKKLLKRKAQHLMAVKKSKTQSIESSLPSTSEASHIAPSPMIQDKPEKELPWRPLLPDSEAEKSARTVAVKDYSYGRERKYYETSAGYRSPAMDYPSAQHFYQPHTASVYGNGGGILRRNLYQFADTVIQHEEQLSKRSRNSNTSPAGSMFGHH